MADMTERLKIVVDATTQGAETRFDSLTSSTEKAAKAADTSAESVAAAADRVAQARAREADAAGKVVVAQTRLDRLRSSGKANAEQLAAAEEKVASAERQVQIAAGQTQRALEAQTVAQQRATTETREAEAVQERTGRASGRMREQLDGLKSSVVGVVAGVTLADWARDAWTGFLNGARGANTLAQSMNATVEQGGQLSALFSTLGLDANDLLEIQAEFATKIGANGEVLEEFGATMQKNDDGTVNWATTLTSALVELQKIPDATERNARGFALFGEEGYKQLSRLLTSGMSVEEALAAIGTPFSPEDVAAAQEYDATMMRLSLASGDLGRTLARNVLPLVTGLVEGLSDLVSIASQIPAPIAAATAVAVAMGVTGFNPLAKGAELARDGIGKLQEAWSGAASKAGEDAGRMSRAYAGARGGLKSLVDFAGGPLGIAMIGVGVVWAAAAASAENLERKAHDVAVEMQRAADSGEDAGTVWSNAQKLRDAASAWDNLGASMRGAAAQRDELEGFDRFLSEASGLFGGFQQTAITGALADEDSAVRGYAEAIEEARKELGELGAQQEVTAQTSRSLTDLIAQGVTSGSAFASAVRDAAEAQRTEETTSGLAAAALDAYAASTWGASAAAWDLINARYAAENAEFAWQKALDEANSTTDDSTTTVNEAREAQVGLMEAALNAASAAADAAVEGRRTAGQIVTEADEARIRADAMIGDLKTRLNEPGLAEGARTELLGLIEQLETAQAKGDIDALVTLTGVDQAEGDLEGVTADRESHVTVESRGGPAVDDYLDGLAAATRLAIIRAESRGGPAVVDYLGGVAGRDRLAIIRVETRGGPAVDDYLDNLASNYGRGRTAFIDVRERGSGGGGGGGGGTGIYGAPTLAGGAGYRLGAVTLDLELRGSIDKGQLSRAQRGRAAIEDIRAYERENGTGWRGGAR